MSKKNVLEVQGLRQNNLKNLSFSIPHNKFVAISGVSGSGKSTLAFDSIHAEGGRRYIETFSPYTRQFLDRLKEPELDAMHGVRPSLALEQRNKTTNSRSTVGTVTEINDYLKIIWANLANLHCPKCETEIEAESVNKIVEKLEKYKDSKLYLGFRLALSTDANPESLAAVLEAQGFPRFFEDNKLKKISELKPTESILVVVDRLVVKDSITKIKKRLISSLNQCYNYGKNKLEVVVESSSNVKIHEFNKTLICKSCNFQTPSPKPSLFSFNSPLGACTECNGFGNVLAVDLDLCIPNPNLSISKGAIAIWETNSTRREKTRLHQFAEEFEIDTEKAWAKLTKREKDLIINGEKNSHRFLGILPWFKKIQKKAYKMHVRVFLSRYRKEAICPKCEGARISKLARSFKIKGKTLPSLWRMSISDARNFFLDIDDPLQELSLKEVNSRLNYLEEIGLSYLSLDRQTRTLSGGEAQRVSLTSILGSRLTNTTLVLDEPTIGLHARDNERLLKTFRDLRDRGNSLIVVEHDPDVLMASDHLIDLGPGAGESGGEIVYSDAPEKITEVKNSLTAKYLNEELGHKRKDKKLKKSKSILIKGANSNNLKSLDIEIPLGMLVVLCGVSGSGKSSLVQNCLLDPFRKLKRGYTKAQVKASSTISDLKNYDQIENIVLVDQSPVGKTPRSNPATYTKAWDVIRECLASTELAEKYALSKSAFSFNVDGGRCANCKGAGSLRVEMQFLADSFVECEVCSGKRFNEQVLLVEYGGKSVTDFLEMTLDDCYAFFNERGEENNSKKVLKAITPMLDLGLGYMRLGQTLNTVSGGEAQRIKLASYLADEQKENLLFVLDEPTTGLHPHNISQLIQTFDKLIEKGHSVLVIEHNLSLIKEADYLIELGPEGGDKGGELIASGFLKDLKNKSSTLKLLSKKEKAKKPTQKESHKIESIKIKGARFHNLKNIELEIPHNKLNLITGVSGSGKSTLAFDLIFSEGQRRYIESLSPYARQYIKQLERADVDYLSDIPPTIALSQKTTSSYGVSTIGSTTEIYQFLRLLFAKTGKQHCPKHNIPISSSSADGLVDLIDEKYSGKRLQLYAPVVLNRKGHYAELFERALKAEIEKARIDGELHTIYEGMRLERHKLHDISLLVASISINEKNKALLKAGIEQVLILSGGSLEVSEDGYETSTYSVQRTCAKCQRGFLALDPQDFSFSSKKGACETCSGKGVVKEKICKTCSGSRLKEIARNVFIDKKTIFDLASLKPLELLSFINSYEYDKRLSPVIDPILSEIRSRLEVIISVGLDYLSLNRDSSSISGGEAQRLRLARCLGSPLTGVCYVLDEPSIGLHAADHKKLMETLFDLRDRGNTLIVVEHDEETISKADYVIDMGPGGGAKGGEIVAQGSYKEFLNNKTSLTAASLRERKKLELKKATSSKKSSDYLKLTKANKNNLKNVDVAFPLEKLSVVAGVSGAGKSSLVHGSLVPEIFAAFEGKKSNLSNLKTLERYIEIDQNPLGKTSSSIPASFLGIFDEIRKCYASIPEAEIMGYKASHFSFNSGKGKCEVCSGRGEIKIPMSFLPEARSICESCQGLRYNEETLEIKYNGLSIGELLQKTMSEVREVFKNHKKIKRSLDYVEELGLAYLTLGQTSSTLSGGEAQRLKIAKELGLREAVNTLYLLDEPSIGLHMQDVDKLVGVLKKLVEKGNTVVVIEHDLDIIRSADYLIELGPGPAEMGGEVVFSGTPWELKSGKVETATKRFL